eukprot:365338-Chlamydomonas_euryale.AAC.39
MRHAEGCATPNPPPPRTLHATQRTLSVNIENAAFVLSKTLFAASLARLAALVMLCETLPMALPASLPFSPRVAMLDPIDRVARSFRALPVFGSDCRLSPAPVELVLVRPNSSVGMRVVGALTALPLLLRSLTSLVASTSPSAAVSAASLTLHACRRSMLLPELHGEPLQLSAPPGKFIADGDHDLSMLLPVLRAPRSRIACVRPGADSGDEHSWMVWRLWAFGTSSDGGGGGGTSTWELLAGAVCSGGAAPGCAAWPAAVAAPCKAAATHNAATGEAASNGAAATSQPAVAAAGKCVPFCWYHPGAALGCHGATCSAVAALASQVASAAAACCCRIVQQDLCRFLF